MPVDVDPGSQHDLNRIAAFLENRLSFDERREMERHLADCRDCRETLAFSSRASARSGTRPGSRVPAWFAAAATLALAGWFGYQTLTAERRAVPASTRRAPSVAPSPDRPARPAALPAPASSSASPGEAGRREEADEEPLGTKRGNERRVGSKTFRFVAGEWIDSAFDPIAGLPVVEARTRGERRAVLERVPALEPFLRTGGRVTVVFDGTVYRFFP